MRNKSYAGFLYFALLGAVIATLCDGVHVYTGTLSYPKPFVCGQAAWVYPGFVLAFLLMEFCYFLVAYRLRLRISVSGGSLRDVVETTTTFALIYLMSALGNKEPVLLSVIFYGTFILRLLFSYERLFLLVLSVGMAIGGMLGEGLLSAMGLVAYGYTDVFHVPFWLGGLYVHGAFAIREGMRYFVYGRKGV